MLRREVVETVKASAIAAGLHAANVPEAFVGAGLDPATRLLCERGPGRASRALHSACVAQPSSIPCAGTPELIERCLLPCVRGETWDCLAMTEPGEGSDLRGMAASAREDGGDWVLNGTKHFISHADVAGFVIAFMATGEEAPGRKRVTAFLADRGG